MVCLDSVRGSGESVREMRSLLKTSIQSLPTMQQNVPRKWVKLLETSRVKLQKFRLLSLDDALDKLKLDDLKLTRKQALEALQFWDDLGYLRLHRGSVLECLVTDIPWLIELLRVLLHHDIVGSLKKVLDGEVAPNDCDLAVAGPKCRRESLTKKKSLLGMAEDLERSRIVRKELLPYLKSWCDLQTEKDVNSALEVLETCLLVAQYRIGEYAPAEWFVTSRIKKPEQSPPITVDLDTLLRTGPCVCCRADYFMPPGLFSSLQAVQILRLRQAACPFTVLFADSTQLHIVLTGMGHSIKAWTGQQQQINSGWVGSESHCRPSLYLQADTLPLLTTLCCDWESIIRDKFPGLMCTFSVLFRRSDPKRVYEWPCSIDEQALDQARNLETPARWKKARGGLGYMLLHGLNMQSDVKLVLGFEGVEAPPVLVHNIPLHEALHPLATAARPFFFLSHCWDSEDRPSALGAAADRVLGGLWDLVEAVSGQGALVSAAGRFEVDACRGAQKVIVILSPAYLACSTCLLELGAALEASLGRGAPLLAVTVDARVHGCIAKRSKDNWAALRDEWGVAEATLRLVQSKVVNGTIRIWREWEDGSGTPNKARWEAAKSMVTFFPAVPLRARSKFEVKDDGDLHELREEASR